MIITKEIEINGQKLRKTYSSKGFYIIQNETGNKYSQAVDVLDAVYTYTETDEVSPLVEELTKKTLTGSDVERALYKAKGMDFEDLKALIQEQLPNIDIKALGIEFRANAFYRGATFNNIPLFDAIGGLLGYTPDDITYLFEFKELPTKGDN